MNTGYYKLPLQVESLMNRDDLPKSNLRDSINQYLRLIIISKFGELDSDINFGCKIWEDDFNLGTNHLNYTEELKEHLQQVIEKYEKRLSAIK
ncbi:MAG: GPW/gp25 family protein, partial [Bacteroidota bacterium]|nr:GPW/gp25 family protein [Bacteroidota bacterium]